VLVKQQKGLELPPAVGIEKERIKIYKKGWGDGEEARGSGSPSKTENMHSSIG